MNDCHNKKTSSRVRAKVDDNTRDVTRDGAWAFFHQAFNCRDNTNNGALPMLRN